MPPAIAAAGITAVASIGGAVMSGKAQKKAAKKAAATAQNNTNANNALARETYSNNAARLDPYSQNGMRASNALSGMLLGTPTTSALAGAGTAPDSEEWANGALQSMGLGSRGNSPATLQAHLAGGVEGPISPQMRQAYDTYVQSHPQDAQAATLVSAPAGSAPAESPWDQFRNSTNYQFRFNEGMRGLNTGLASKGLLDSGAAVKAALTYGQNFASNELGNYMNLLAQQQNMGLGAASALAGVSQNMVGQVTANNNSAADAAGNAALIRGNATANTWGGIASGIGQVAGALGSSYGGGGSQTFNVPQWSPSNLAMSLGGR
jgi:hypothetical protein